MSPNISAIILAAGESRRMGQPKLLLPWGITSVLGQVISTIAKSNIENILVITGAHREKVEVHIDQLAKDYPVRCVFNPDYASGGMLSSIKCGVRYLMLTCTAIPEMDQSEAVLVVLGDQPQVKQETVRDIINAYQVHGSALVLPSYNGRQGHPWLLARPLWEEMSELPATMTARQFLQANNHKITYIPSDRSILQDLDTPDDYRRFHP